MTTIALQLKNKVSSWMKKKAPLKQVLRDDVVLSTHHLSVSYRDIVALDNINITIKQGDMIALVGPNGGGKSSFLKVLAGVLKQRKGHVAFHGNHHVAYLPQLCEVDRTFPLTVGDVVAMGLWRLAGAFSSVKKNQLERVSYALKKVGLEGFEDRPLSALSGGQFQRVLFARLVVQDAPIVLLDEPFNNLDAKTIYDLMGLIQEWHQAGKTVVVVLHDLNVVRKFFNHVLLLDKTCIAQGTTDHVLQKTYLEQAYRSTMMFH